MNTTYTVRYQKDDSGWWVVSVKEVKGCHTQGRTIEQARRRIREALDLFVDDAEDADLIDDVVLPVNARALLSRVRATRKGAEAEASNLKSSTVEAVNVFTKDVGMSVRDAGAILGLSHQRVQQLLTSTTSKKRTAGTK